MSETKPPEPVSTSRELQQPVYYRLGSPLAPKDRTQDHNKEQTRYIIQAITYLNEARGEESDKKIDFKRIFEDGVVEKYIDNLPESTIIQLLTSFGRSKEYIESWKSSLKGDLLQYLILPIQLVKEQKRDNGSHEFFILGLPKKNVNMMQAFFEELGSIWDETYKKNNDKNI